VAAAASSVSAPAAAATTAAAAASGAAATTAAAAAAAAAARSPSTDTLALVLSTTGALGLRAERRDVQHRRTRRGKQRERRRAEALLQPRLFKS
jgi:hypothetical protein